MIKLFIDTSDKDFSKIELVFDKKKIKAINKSNRKSQSLLPLILKTLEENSLKLSNLTEIEVYTKSGSFTGLRIGISIGQALAYVLNIPLNNELIDFKNPVTPEYL